MGESVKLEEVRIERRFLNKGTMAPHAHERPSFLPTIADLLGYCLLFAMAWVTYLFVNGAIDFLQLSQERIATSLRPYVEGSDSLVPLDSDSVSTAQESILGKSMHAAQRSVDALARDMSRQREKVEVGDIDPPSPFELTR